MINSEELKNAIRESNINIPINQIEKIIYEVDYLGNGKINYSEFLAATVDVHNILNEETLKEIFSLFDVDGSGSIT